MPMVRYSKTLLSNVSYSQLTALERLTLIELSMFNPMPVDEALLGLGNREATFKALEEKNLIARNSKFFVVTSDLFKVDNAATRTAVCRENKKVLSDISLPIVRIKKEATPYQQIAELYNEHLAIPKQLTQCKKFNAPKLLRGMDKAWEDFSSEVRKKNPDATKEQILVRFENFFKYMATDNTVFLKGDGVNGQGWVASLEYVLRPEKIVDVINKARTKKQ